MGPVRFVLMSTKLFCVFLANPWVYTIPWIIQVTGLSYSLVTPPSLMYLSCGMQLSTHALRMAVTFRYVM
jgi:hypothetical protein